MKTSKADFNIFKKECKRLIDEWELNNWDMRYVHAKIDDAYAEIVRDGENFDAAIILNTEVEGKIPRNITQKDYFKKLAKHECIHLLLGNLTHCGESRWCTEEEMNRVEEELVRKLIRII